MKENEISGLIVNAAYEVHTVLGPGLFESVYESAMVFECEQRKLRVQRQVLIPVRYKGREFDEGFRADLIVENKVIVELKSVEQLANVHKKQLLTYLRLTDLRLGLLLNFDAPLIKNGIVRVVNRLEEDSSSAPLRLCER